MGAEVAERATMLDLLEVTPIMLREGPTRSGVAAANVALIRSDLGTYTFEVAEAEVDGLGEQVDMLRSSSDDKQIVG